MKQQTDSKMERIRQLNDGLRKDLSLGTAVMTPGIAALGPEAVDRLVQSISAYELFTGDNDPYGEHDFGTIEFEGQTVFWKIDYHSKSMDEHSPDPADPSVSERVITLMLAEEY